MSLEGSCPLGLLPTLGPWALVPARELSGIFALLPEPPQAISRHKILRPAKSHNMSMARPQVTFCPTPQLPTRGFLEKGSALCWSTFPCGQHNLPAWGQAWLPRGQGLGIYSSHRSHWGGARGMSAVGPDEATPRPAFTGLLPAPRLGAPRAGPKLQGWRRVREEGKAGLPASCCLGSPSATGSSGWQQVLQA